MKNNDITNIPDSAIDAEARREYSNGSGPISVAVLQRSAFAAGVRWAAQKIGEVYQHEKAGQKPDKR